MERENLLKFMGKKIIGVFITVFFVMSILFFLLHAVPGGDIATRMAPFAGAEAKAQIREVWGLDEPLYIQYAVFMKKVFTLDYRPTGTEEIDAMDLILTFLPYTILLFGTATILSYLIGTFIGMRMLSETHSGGKIIALISMILYAIPAFVLAVYFKSWFIFKYHLFSPLNIRIGNFGGFNPYENLLTDLQNTGVLLEYMILPTILLIMVGVARPLFLLKDQMTVISKEPFILTAKAKGLTEGRIRSHHLARSALLPLLNDASINIALIISGGILIEYIFNWPGIGTILLHALKALHYPTITASIFLLTLIILISMIITDLFNAYLDPRVMVT